MKVVINQPTYLAWIGYFDLIDQADLFVALDNVQFVKQSWQQRNRIRTPDGLQWLTVPVEFRGRLGQLLKDVQIRDPSFGRKHIRGIELAYRRAPYFDEYFPSLAAVIERRCTGLLSDLNLELIEWAVNALGISTPMVRASNLGLQGKRTELLAAICEKVGANQYLSPAGSACYLLAEASQLTDRGIEVLFHHYQHPHYRQVFASFESYAAVIDLVFNQGPESLGIVRQGRREDYSLEQMALVRNEALNLEIATSPL